MTKTLDELLELPGVVAAAEFVPDGTLLEFKGDLELGPSLQNLTARLSARVGETFDELAQTYSTISAMRWTPRRFWTYSGGDWTAAAGSDRLVFARTSEANLDALYEALA